MKKKVHNSGATLKRKLYYSGFLYIPFSPPKLSRKRVQSLRLEPSHLFFR